MGRRPRAVGRRDGPIPGAGRGARREVFDDPGEGQTEPGGVSSGMPAEVVLEITGSTHL